jgi:hydroxyacylglutathione hydrolase
MLTIHPISAFNDNYIWAMQNDGHCVIVDPGDASVVLETLTKQSLTLAAILITHHHKDHTGGVEALLNHFDVPVFGPSNSPFKGITHPVVDGQRISVLDTSFTVMEVPGHTLDHIAFTLNRTINRPFSFVETRSF